MSVSTTENEGVVALHDTTSGACFGPAFYTNEEAEAFLVWLTDNADENNAFEIDGGTVRYEDDPRKLTLEQLDVAVQNFRNERDEEDE